MSKEQAFADSYFMGYLILSVVPDGHQKGHIEINHVYEGEISYMVNGTEITTTTLSRDKALKLAIEILKLIDDTK